MTSPKNGAGRLLFHAFLSLPLFPSWELVRGTLLASFCRTPGEDFFMASRWYWDNFGGSHWPHMSSWSPKMRAGGCAGMMDMWFPWRSTHSLFPWPRSPHFPGGNEAECPPAFLQERSRSIATILQNCFLEGMERGALYLKESPPFFGCQPPECKRFGGVNARGLGTLSLCGVHDRIQKGILELSSIKLSLYSRGRSWDKLIQFSLACWSPPFRWSLSPGI